MLDQLKVLFLVMIAYGQSGIDKTHSFVKHLVSKTESVSTQVSSKEQCDFFVSLLQKADPADYKEAINYLQQDNNPYGQQLVKVLPCCQERKVDLDRKQLESVIYLLPKVVTSYQARSLVLMIVLSAAKLSDVDRNELTDIWYAHADGRDNNILNTFSIFYAYNRHKFMWSAEEWKQIVQNQPKK